MKFVPAKLILLFSISSLLTLSAFAETQERIVKIDEVGTDRMLNVFQDLVVMQSFQNRNINLNPIPYLDSSEENRVDKNPLARQTKEVESIYVGFRTLNTQIPIHIFATPEFKDAKIQSELFKDVTFSSCTVDHCMAKQNTLLGEARYEMVYKFLDAEELSQISIPEKPLSTINQKNIKYALIQNAYNWNDFFSSGFNLILVSENDQKNAQIIAFQAFLLTPHFNPDKIYLMNISRTLDAQIKSFTSALNNHKKAWLAAQGSTNENQ